MEILQTQQFTQNNLRTMLRGSMAKTRLGIIETPREERARFKIEPGDIIVR